MGEHMVNVLNHIYLGILNEQSIPYLILFVFMMKVSFRIVLVVIIFDFILEKIHSKYIRMFNIFCVILPLAHYVASVIGVVNYSIIDIIISFIPIVTILIVRIVHIVYNKTIKRSRERVK